MNTSMDGIKTKQDVVARVQELSNQAGKDFLDIETPDPGAYNDRQQEINNWLIEALNRIIE